VPDRADTGSMPLTEPHEAPIFDTGPHPQPITPRATNSNPWFDPTHAEPVDDIFGPTDVLLAEREGRQTSEPAHPVVVPGQYQFLKVWKLITVLCGVWLIAGALGLGLYYWWFRAPDKTWVEVSVLMYVIVSVVGALLVSLPDQRPGLSATSIAVLTAPFASVMAAGVLYGAFAFGWVSP
jgi:hypothetical protein